jgi:hypothetical protein
MVAYALGALRYMRYCHGDKLFRFFRERPVFENCSAEIAE